MEQLAHFVTKSFEYNNNRVMDVINMTQNTRSMLCGDPFRNVDRISTKSTNRGGGDDDASSGLDEEENTMDIDITDFSTDDEEVNDTAKTQGGSQHMADTEYRARRDTSELGITSTLLRLSAANFRNAMGRLDNNVGSEGKILFGRTIPDLSETITTSDTTQQMIKKKHATKNWLISDSPKRNAVGGKWMIYLLYLI